MEVSSRNGVKPLRGGGGVGGQAQSLKMSSSYVSPIESNFSTRIGSDACHCSRGVRCLASTARSSAYKGLITSRAEVLGTRRLEWYPIIRPLESTVGVTWAKTQ